METTELYFRLALAKEVTAVKRDTVLYLIGSEGRSIYKTLNFDKEEKDRTVEDLVHMHLTCIVLPVLCRHGKKQVLFS
jgi:hypothetical protein